MEVSQRFSDAQRLSAAIFLALANFIVVLDLTIANVAIPHIAGGLAVSPSQATWAITSYAIADAVAVPLTAWISTRYGSVRVFLVALVAFGAFSLLCGLAPTFGSLIVFRICQGFAGGPMIPLSQALLLRVFPKSKSSSAIAIWGLSTVTAPIFGPLLGGIICDNSSWPWIFFVNVPIVVACTLGGAALLKRAETSTAKSPIDYVGFGLLVTWVGSLQIVLDRGRELEWFSSPLIAILSATALVGFIAFVIWELTDRNPIVDLRIFRHKAFSLAAGILCLGWGAYFAGIVILPLWLQTSQAYTATSAGYVMCFNGVLGVLASPLVSKLGQKADLRLLACGGLAVISCAFTMRLAFFTQLDFGSIAMTNLIQGLGIPFFFLAIASISVKSVDANEITNATSMLSFSRTLAASFSAAVATTVWENNASLHRVDILDRSSTNLMPSIRELGAEGQARSLYEGLVGREALMMASLDIFFAIAAVSALSAIAIWLVPARYSFETPAVADQPSQDSGSTSKAH